jgi:flagellar biosynthesis/type III secretory pathway protein FliH
MSNHTLEEIVAVEKELQAHLAEEQRKVAEWLAAERDGITRATEEKLAEARQHFRQRLAAAAAEAGDVVDEVVQQAEAYAERLKSLPEERLRLLVRGYLQRLWPERRG